MPPLPSRLLTKLMCVDPRKRMRTQAEVTSDPFFFEIGDWEAVAAKRLPPPFIPALPRGRRHNPGYFDLEVSGRTCALLKLTTVG